MEERLKNIEINLSYLQRDLAKLLENLQQPEMHLHIYNDYRTMINEEDCPDECDGDCDNCKYNE